MVVLWTDNETDRLMCACGMCTGRQVSVYAVSTDIQTEKAC